MATLASQVTSSIHGPRVGGAFASGSGSRGAYGSRGDAQTSRRGTLIRRNISGVASTRAGACATIDHAEVGPSSGGTTASPRMNARNTRSFAGGNPDSTRALTAFGIGTDAQAAKLALASAAALASTPRRVVTVENLPPTPRPPIRSPTVTPASARGVAQR